MRLWCSALIPIYRAYKAHLRENDMVNAKVFTPIFLDNLHKALTFGKIV